LATLRNYLDALGELCLDWRGDDQILIAGAASDSRDVRPGWLFCAIPGAREDGAKYVPSALGQGASCILAERPLAVPAGVATILVSDAYAAAGRIAEVAAGHPAERLRVLGITGTNGKTTCAFLLRQILRAAGRKPAMIGTVEYDLCGAPIPADRTTPTPFRLQALIGQAVQNRASDLLLEVSSHALAQLRLGQMPVSGALFTNLTGDHLDYHLTFEDYYAAKRLLFTECLADHAPAVINIEDDHGARLHAELVAEKRVRPISVGEAGGAEARIVDVRTGLDGSAFTLALPDRAPRLHSPLIGKHNVENLAGAATLAWALGVPTPTIQEACQDCTGAPGRLEAVTAPQGFAVYVDYAHTDDALENVLKALRQLSPKRILVVFGCGGDRDTTKRARMGEVAARLADRVIVTSDNPRTEDPETILDDIESGIPAACLRTRLADRRAAIRAAVAEAQAGDVVLVAGKGHEEYQEIHGNKLPFSDIQEVRAAIADRS
jgi:UDP-N-acetylmuramoyl-L-alanyl-D-glutamate--2,6-diaminopimelate ligase